jgi:SH3-like domain-containing protein
MAKNEPLAIIQEYNEWREIIDINGSKGWVHSSILSPKRYVITSGSDVQKLHKFSNEKSRIIANVEPNVRCLLKSIGKNYCKVSCDSHTGWLKKDKLWGLLKEEQD